MSFYSLSGAEVLYDLEGRDQKWEDKKSARDVEKKHLVKKEE